MNKKIFYTAAIIAMAYFSKAQTWDSLGSGSGGAECVCTYNGNVIVGGDIHISSGNPGNGITQWNGTSWVPIGLGMNAYGYFVSTVASYNGNLFAGGSFDSAGGIYTSGIAQWNGTAWSTVGAIVDPTYVVSLEVYNGNLYAGGAFDSIGGTPANDIAEWNGTVWSALGSGINATGGIFSMVEYNGELYVGGGFDSAGGIAAKDIAKWNGTTWSAVGSGINTIVYSMCVYEGNLYASGGASGIEMWNGSSWLVPGGGMTGGTVYALTSYNHELIAGGSFYKAGPNISNGAAQWDGNSWSPLSSETINGTVYSLCTYNSSLIVGGWFGSIGSLDFNGIASWTGGPLSEVNICYVTVDTASKYNEVLWDKTSIDTNLVDSIRLYRKGFLSYDYIGHVSVHNYTEFIDSTSQPNITNSTYEISTVDTSGLLSQFSENANQTILLQANVGVGNVVNLSWNAYMGDSVSYYVILRDSTGTGNWQRFDSVPDNVYAFTDINPPVSNNLRYVVNTVWNLSCVPYTNTPRRHRVMSSYEVTSRSNTKQLQILTGMASVNNIPSVSIYPNPSKDVVTITLSKQVDAVITLNDVLGQTIYSEKLSANENVKQLNLSAVNNGVYFLKLALSNGSEVVKKMVIQR